MESVDTVEDNKLCPNKCGISGWMKSNFGRLNAATDFESYGSSPPETENCFHLCHHNKKSLIQRENFSAVSAGEKNAQTSDNVVGSIPANHNNQLPTHLPVPHLSSILMESLTDDTGSSTDNSPFVTPQGSPMIIRRNQVINADLTKDVATQNTKKWFFKGFIPENDQIEKNKITDISPISHSPTGRKYIVSNFDINAISPSSW